VVALPPVELLPPVLVAPPEENGAEPPALVTAPAEPPAPASTPGCSDREPSLTVPPQANVTVVPRTTARVRWRAARTDREG